MTTPKTIAAAEFKARCLRLMDDVALERTSITITKRGKPVARLIPAKTEEPEFLGFLRDRVAHTGDIIAPTGEVWDAERTD